LSDCTQEAVFTQNLLEELTNDRDTAIIYEDNLGAIYLLKAEDRIDIRFVRSEDNYADIATKNTEKATHDKHANSIRNGTLKCWMEDVKADPSVRLYEQGSKQD